MKTEIKTIYKCDFCNKLYQRKNSAEYHERICNKNPSNQRPCYGCSYLEKKEASITIGYSYDGDEILKKVQIFHCKFRNVFLHTPKNEIKGNVFDVDENYPMPITCSDKKVFTFDEDFSWFA
jgi:hypothetical protein